MRFRFIAISLGFAAAALSAHADDLRTYDLSGAFTSFNYVEPYITSYGNLSGTTIIDQTTGAIASANIAVTLDQTTFTFTGAPTAQGPDPFSALPDDPDQIPSVYDATFMQGPDTFQLNLGVGYAFDLKNFFGGDVCAFNGDACPDTVFSLSYLDSPSTGDVYLYDGYLSPAAPTPEPASLALALTGAAGLAGLVRRRLTI